MPFVPIGLVAQCCLTALLAHALFGTRHKKPIDLTISLNYGVCAAHALGWVVVCSARQLVARDSGSLTLVLSCVCHGGTE